MEKDIVVNNLVATITRLFSGDTPKVSRRYLADEFKIDIMHINDMQEFSACIIEAAGRVPGAKVDQSSAGLFVVKA